MSRVPRKPPAIPRSSELPTDAVAGRAIVPKPTDARQPDLLAPGFIQPCKPTLRDKLPVGPRWQYELKFDGYRIQAHLDGDAVRLFTKNGFDRTESLPAIAAAVRELPVQSAILDGEAVILDDESVSDFFALHAAMARGRAPDAVLIAFDLLMVAGEDLRPRPLAERRARLTEILVGAPPGLELSPHVNSEGAELLKAVCARGLEGVVAKRIDAPYRSGYVETWIKAKCTEKESFAVIGFDPQGSKGVAALKLARLVEGVLTPCGYVGSGITAVASGEIRRALDAGEHLVVDVEFRGWTPAGELRHAVFKGWHR